MNWPLAGNADARLSKRTRSQRSGTPCSDRRGAGSTHEAAVRRRDLGIGAAVAARPAARSSQRPGRAGRRVVDGRPRRAVFGANLQHRPVPRSYVLSAWRDGPALPGVRVRRIPARRRARRPERVAAGGLGGARRARRLVLRRGPDYAPRHRRRPLDHLRRGGDPLARHGPARRRDRPAARGPRLRGRRAARLS